MGVGIIHWWQESPQRSEWKTTEVSVHFVFSDPGVQVLVHTAGPFLILFTKGYTNHCSIIASSLLSMVNSIPLSIFVQKFSSSLVSLSYESRGTNRIES